MLVDRTQSNRCSNALKCQKWAIKTKILMPTPGPLVQRRTFSSQVFKLSAIKKIDRKILMLTPGPLVQQISFVDRTFSSQVFKFFKSKGRRRQRRNHEQKVNKVLVQQKWPPVQQILLFDRTFSCQVFKSIISMLTPGPLVQQISFFDRTFSKPLVRSFFFDRSFSRPLVQQISLFD